VSELLRGYYGPIGIELTLDFAICVAPLPKLGLPQLEPVVGAGGLGRNYLVLTGSADFGESYDFFGIVNHVEHLVRSVTYLAVLLLALIA
jgi:hypothetical protein